ncbi:PREDICTED: putative F-box protein At1g20795 [Camelina sativa]|uniref:F-box protein At1g20795 n=1 Tax=Camelina sativa TaxID=90675 RepID=A0ABM0TTZ2_CAMSA|nr:PREDICTED: putative F-box protein At1g20795 [Camelina sativa]
MDSLPLHILDEILFKLDLKSLAMMQCTGRRSLKSYISDKFKYEYLSGHGSHLLHISTFGSNIIFWHSWGDPRFASFIGPLRYKNRILSSCSGLHLLFHKHGLFVRNPLTNTSQFLDHSGSNLLPLRSVEGFRLKRYKVNRFGLAVDQIDQRFKVVCIKELSALNFDGTMYQFVIRTGESCWRLSETTITCDGSSNLMRRMKSVYFNGYVHWLREDGKILAFNPETEQARLIPIKFPQEHNSTVRMLAAADKELRLITETEEVIFIYALESILTTDDRKWVLMKRYEKRERVRYSWNVAAYDGKCVMVREKEEERYNGVVHVYDLKREKRVASFTSLIWRLIDGITYYEKKRLKKRSIDEKEGKLYVDLLQRFNKRMRSLLVNE